MKCDQKNRLIPQSGPTEPLLKNPPALKSSHHIFASERACKLKLIPEKGVQIFGKGVSPIQNLSGRDFARKTLWLGFGEAKPNLPIFRRKNHCHLRF